MAAGAFKVTPEQLNQLGGQVAKTANDVQSMHTSLNGQLEPLKGGEWSGGASAAFTELYNQFNKNAEGLNQALDGISKLMNAAGQSYATAEQQILNSFRQ